jgi:nitrogen regulatory protein P-II 1
MTGRRRFSRSWRFVSRSVAQERDPREDPSPLKRCRRKNAVKLIVAVIQPTKLSAVREALEKIEVARLTVCDAQGFGRQRGRTEMFRGHEYTTTLLRKVAIEIVVNDDFLDRTIATILSAARIGPEGTIGDGKIFVLPAEQAVQINDGARGPGAV